jgi:aminoglycoside phosphotransferase family enzyme
MNAVDPSRMTTDAERIDEALGVTLADKVRALKSPLAYEHPPRSIEALETHFAWLFFADEYAYKLKKPMRFSQLDLVSLTARQFICREEMRLSRRLAPDVYLDVLPLTREADGVLKIAGRGEPVDWLLKMRRLPADLMLDRAAGKGDVSEARLARLGAILAAFYGRQQRIPFDARAYLRRMSQRIGEDCADLRSPELKISPPLVDELEAAQVAALARIEPELVVRAEEQRIVEGHGDLRPEHVFVGDPPCVIDSLEFSFDLRTLDPLEELAYFRIECERMERRWMADVVLAAYRAASGDPGSDRLLEFYASRRAAVRAKVVAWHLRDPAVRDQAPWAQRASEYLTRAIECVRAV